MRGRMGGMRRPGGPGDVRRPGGLGGPPLGPPRMRSLWNWFPGMRRRGCGCLLPVLGIIAILGIAFLR